MPPVPHYDVRVSRHQGEPIVVLAGDIDLAATGALWSTLEAAMGHGPRLVLDLTDATFIDSSCLAVLFRAFRAQGQAKEAMVLRAPSPLVLRTIQMTGLDAVLTIEPAPL